MKARFHLTPLFLFSLVFSLVIVSSCSREDSQSAQEEEYASKVSAEAESEAETVFNNAFDDAFGVNTEVGLGATGIFGRSSIGDLGGGEGTERPFTCPLITITHPPTAQFPKHVVIDFGPVGCIGRDGHHRRGKIIIDYTNRLTIPGAVAETSFENFFIDSIHVQGVHRIQNTGSLIPLVRSFKVDVINGKLTKPNGNYIQWNSTREIVQVEGLLTPDFPHDDVFRITGHGSGSVLRGNLLVRWESNIREPLIKRFNCRWVVKGVIRVVRGPNSNNPWIAELDFGYPNPGTCDNQAKLTINGQVHIITLP